MNGEAYDRESQNNSRLSELSAKVTALRGVTVDIYDNARAQDVIDNTVCGHKSFFALTSNKTTEGWMGCEHSMVRIVLIFSSQTHSPLWR